MTSPTTDRRYGAVGSVAIKAPVIAATTANITLSGEQTIDGVSCVTDDRVLVKDQTTASENGIYVVDTGSWSRAKDFDSSYDVVTGTLIPVTSGATQDDTYWRVTTTGTITIGTSSLSFTQATWGDSSMVSFSAAGAGAVTRTSQAKLRDFSSFLDYGCTGDGIVDDTSGVQAAVTSGENIDGKGLTYKITSPITGFSSNQIIRNAVFDFSAMPAQVGTDNCFLIAGTLGSSNALTGNTLRHASGVSIADTSSFSADDLVFLASSAVWDSNTSTVYGMYNRIKSVDSGTGMTLYSDALLNWNAGLPDSAEIYEVTPVQNVRIERCKFIGAQANSQIGVYVKYGENVQVIDCEFTTFDHSGIGFWRSVGCVAERNRITYARGTGLSYGIGIWGGCYGCSAINNYGEDTRHLVTIGDNDGVNTFTRVIGNHAFNSKDAGVDSHSASMFTVVMGNTVHSSAATASSNHDGITMQGMHPIVVGNNISGCKGTGIYIQPMFQVSLSTSVIVSDNQINMDDTGDGSGSASAILVLISPTIGANIDGLVISNNTFRGGVNNTTYGVQHIYLYAQADSSHIRRATITGNLAVDSAATPAYPFYIRAGGDSSEISDLFIQNNVIRANGGDYAIRLLANGASAIIKNAIVGNNTIHGGAVANLAYTASGAGSSIEVLEGVNLFPTVTTAPMSVTSGTVTRRTQGYVLAQSAVAVTGALDTNENTFATVTIPAHAIGKNGRIVVHTAWTHTNSNNKTLRVKFGGTNTTARVVSTAGTVTLRTEGFNRNSSASQLWKPADYDGIGTSTGAIVTSSIDTTAAVTLLITGQKATGTDALTLESYSVEIFPR